jgi:Rrf2 family iron-sulfur cluster assembly transcriptional regulator
MRITKWAEYGILCCVYLAYKSGNKPVGSKEISEYLNIPYEYVQQIFQKLKNSKLVKTSRGPGGGYSLAKNPEEISLKDILEATEGNTLELICDTNSIFSHCSDTSHECSLKRFWKELKTSIDNLLANTKLSQIADSSFNIPTQNLVQITK